MTEPEKRPQEPAGSSRKLHAANAPHAAEMPRRRVGTVTMGVCLIAAGVFFLLYYFFPGFNAALVLKIAPAGGLILLGGEVLYFAARPERWKYDFLAVFSSLILMTVCFGLTLLPLFWEEVDPAKSTQMNILSRAYESQTCEALEKSVPQIRIRDLNGYFDRNYGAEMPETVAEAKACSYTYLEIGLRGPYTDTETFGADCRRLVDALNAASLCPDRLSVSSDNDGWECYLQLNSPAQFQWTAEEMSTEAHCENYREDLDAGTGEELDEENEPVAPGETAV